MLAFTTVLPIMHITQTYAQWSGKVNREIFQDFADGNAISNETIVNVRTVRAISTEEYERQRYGTTLAKALAKGVKDATIGSCSTLFSTWLGATAALQDSSLLTFIPSPPLTTPAPHLQQPDPKATL